MNVVLCLYQEDLGEWAERLAAALPGANVTYRRPDEPAGDPSAADYVVVGAPSATLFVDHPAPKAVFALSAGVRYVLRMPGLSTHVPVIRLTDAGMAASMTRYVLAAALRFALQIDLYDAQRRAHRWLQHPARDPSTIKAGVLGLGVLGTSIAQGLLSQGFQVRGHSRSAKVVPGVQCHAGLEQLQPFMDGLDLLVSVLPATDETAGILNRQTLARLADGAHLVNIGRGMHVDEDDLIALLESGKLSGATLDVFADEPLPASHPLWERDDVTLTPHVSGLTQLEPSVAQIAQKIERLERGEPVEGVVNRLRGY